jgi:ferrous iron transport protein B
MKSCCQMSSSCGDDAAQGQYTTLSIALVGNPNGGKTTLFNALTGARQHVGNWPGVTVERKSGVFTYQGSVVEVVDLPGVYSLTLSSETAAMDERIASEFILQRQADVIINIVDASNLERHLYLTTQLLEMGAPVVLALNMMDVARARQIHIDIKQLARGLGCPVVALEAKKGGGIVELKRTIIGFDKGFDKSPASQPTPRQPLSYPVAVETGIATLAAAVPVSAQKNNTLSPQWLAMRLLEEDNYVSQLVPGMQALVREQQTAIQRATGEEADILLADARYRYIGQLLQQCLSRTAVATSTWTARIDSIVLNRAVGIPIFLGIMYLLFVFAINIGGAFQDFFDIGSQTIFVDGFAYLLENIGAPTWLTALLANGIGKGLNTTITFIPVIGSMFLFLALLEDSGYMARAAFVIDRFMRALGLPGKAFVPMIVGFGCNVPAVMGARTLENKRDRILTIMMTPFMSCGARLAIFAVFTTAFFPRGGQNIVFALYLIGIGMAILTGFLLRKTVLKGDPSPLVMELPPYHVPHLNTLLLHAWQRLKGFVVRAGRLIVPICVLIGALNALNLDGTINTGDGDAHSLLSLVGQWSTPLFAPMGIHTDNWPATVGLVTGVLAKEVVVGTLNALYSQVGHFAGSGGAGAFQLWAGLSHAVHSIPQNLGQLSEAFSNPVLAQAPTSTVNQGVYGLMFQKFDGQIGAFAYLLFVLLYFPCISTMAVMMRELHRGWSVFSGFWMTGVAYGTAVTFYQAATWSRHPLSSSFWIISIVGVFFATTVTVRWYAGRQGHQAAAPIVAPLGAPT